MESCKKKPVRQNCCPHTSYHVSNMCIKFHQETTGHSVADVTNVGMNLVKLTNQASLRVNIFLLNKLCKLLSLPSAVILYALKILHYLNERFPMSHRRDF
jgi:hypothetical protein